jgi:hypothetical protein
MRGAALCRHHARVGVAAWGGPLDGRFILPVDRSQIQLALLGNHRDVHQLELQSVRGAVPPSALGLYVLEWNGPWRAGLRYRWHPIGRQVGVTP